MRRVDPVCRMEVETEGAPTVELAGRRFYFCCEGCRQRFAEHPERYADLDHEVSEEVLAETESLAAHWFG
jgi:YHS domain-containing protein